MTSTQVIYAYQEQPPNMHSFPSLLSRSILVRLPFRRSSLVKCLYRCAHSALFGASLQCSQEDERYFIAFLFFLFLKFIGQIVVHARQKPIRQLIYHHLLLLLLLLLYPLALCQFFHLLILMHIPLLYHILLP